MPVLFVLVGEVFAQDMLLTKVPQLQETARRANRGEFGRAIGHITLITSRGQVKAELVSATPNLLFGQPIKISDLLPLLDARAEFNRTGVINPMSGQVADLTYVVLYTLSLAKDPEAIPVIAALLKDKESVIHGWIQQLLSTRLLNPANRQEPRLSSSSSLKLPLIAPKLGA